MPQPSPIFQLLSYQANNGKNYYDEWIDSLDRNVRFDILAQVKKIEVGLGWQKELGEKLWELKIDVGPGYRVYFCRDGAEVILLLAGSEKNDRRELLRSPESLYGRSKYTNTRGKERNMPFISHEDLMKKYLAKPEDAVLYLNACLKDGNPWLIADAFRLVEKIHGTSQNFRITFEREEAPPGRTARKNRILHTAPKPLRAPAKRTRRVAV